MATCSSILAWKIPQTEGPGGLQSMGVTKSRTRLRNRALVETHCTNWGWPGNSWTPVNECWRMRDFPGGPMVKALHFHHRGYGFNPWSRIKNSHLLGGKSVKKKNAGGMKSVLVNAQSPRPRRQILRKIPGKGFVSLLFWRQDSHS